MASWNNELWARMSKPLSQVGRIEAGQTVLSASDFNAIRDFVKRIATNITVEAPLEIQIGSGTIHLRASGLLRTGTRGELLWHDGNDWVPFPIPPWDAVLLYNNDTHQPEWIEIIEDCWTTSTTPGTTSTTPEPTTSTWHSTTTTESTTAGTTSTTPEPTTSTSTTSTTTEGTTSTTVEPTTTTWHPTTTEGTTTTTPIHACCKPTYWWGFCSAACTDTIVLACDFWNPVACADMLGNCTYRKQEDPSPCGYEECRYESESDTCYEATTTTTEETTSTTPEPTTSTSTTTSTTTTTEATTTTTAISDCCDTPEEWGFCWDEPCDDTLILACTYFGNPGCGAATGNCTYRKQPTRLPCSAGSCRYLPESDNCSI